MHKIHTLLVTTYLVLGLTLMATTEWSALPGLLSSGGGTILVESAHGAAEDPVMLSEAVTATAKRAGAAKHLALGILLVTLGGFVHAFYRARNERNVPIHIKKTPKTIREKTVYWLEMKI